MARSRLSILLLACACALAVGCGAAGGDSGAASADCGTVNSSSTADDAFADCFDEHFESCKSGRITIDNEAEQLEGTVVKYEIEGPSSGACRVRWRYVTLPANPSWEGKDVVCSYVRGSSFQTALRSRGDFTGCTGPLLKLIGGGSGTSSGGTSSSGTITVP